MVGKRYSDNWPEIRKQVYQRDNYTCQICNNQGGRLNCHHLVSLSKGGTNEKSNLETLCQNCHEEIHPHLKKAKEQRKYKSQLIKKPAKIKHIKYKSKFMQNK